ncbi:hypothetical protein VSH64_22565 [Amycolatopsis rhabdoformis]|uniref:Uncharacterized protein n=1 Tax=Amycolatopsis rhabdoformis TaxID=1448059 RepID=A0ABZ1IK48_9PSEU|nr:hypothetical protein [Amycolatopsis rhabdoformis]WSE34827.1 hypothetical protein VSH64_22565 [Amycolatopsis rhabdoformis]
MTAPVEEVAAANLAGRLHPSQRRIVLNFTFWLCLVVGGIAAVVCVVLPTATNVFEGPNRAQSIGTYPFIVVLALVCLGLCVRRYRDLHKPLTVVTGWAHDFGRSPITDAYPIGLRFEKGTTHTMQRCEVRVGGKTYNTDLETWQKIKPERNNTLCLYPKTKLVINVIPS